VAVQIDLKKHGQIREDFWDGLISESFEEVKADFVKRRRLCE
jgi:hypothetical protein